MRSLTPVEAAAGVAIAGALLAAAIPSFVSNLHASRLVEPIDGLNHLAIRAAALAGTRPARTAYPESVGLTPAKVPKGEPVEDPPGTWDHPTWKLLEFEKTAPHSFSFSFESRNAAGHAMYRARAHGDLDGDGVLSSFEISGELRDGSEPITHPMEIHREVE